jgi:hypothetical protein
MYVVITKTVGDLPMPRPPQFKDVDPNYPVACVEGDKWKDLVANFPGKRVMTVEAYRGYKEAMNMRHGTMPENIKRPWWKFWSKK